MFPIRDHNPSERTPFVTLALILANVAVFLWSLQFNGSDLALYQFYESYALVPLFVSNGENYHTFISSAFLHGGFMHLGGNMLFLWIFGDNMEEEMGHFGFLAFYLASAVASGLAQVLADPGSNIPMVGASGAVAGVMGGYLLLFPKARVDVLFIFIIIFKVFPIPAWIVLSVWFAIQLFSGASLPSAEGGVAYWAHAGGFVAGLAMTLPLWTRRGGVAFWNRVHGHPPHPEAQYRRVSTSIPQVSRRRR